MRAVGRVLAPRGATREEKTRHDETADPKITTRLCTMVDVHLDDRPTSERHHPDRAPRERCAAPERTREHVFSPAAARGRIARRQEEMARPFVLKSSEDQSHGMTARTNSEGRVRAMPYRLRLLRREERAAASASSSCVLPPVFQANVLPNVLNCIREESDVFCRIFGIVRAGENQLHGAVLQQARLRKHFSKICA